MVRARSAPLLLLALALACSGGRDAPGVPRRIVALVPSVAETLFALGLGGKVVGVGDYCHWPPEIETLPRLGGLFDPNLESIVALKPDLAVLLPSEVDLGRELERVGIATLTVGSDTLEDVDAAVAAIAGRCGVPEAGERLRAQLAAGLAPDPLPGRPRVMLTVGRAPGRLSEVLAVGPGSFLAQLLERMGAENVFADAPIPYPQVSLEEVVARAPAVIVELEGQTTDAATATALIADWRSLPGMPAVTSGRIYVLGGDYVVVPGPRLPRLYFELRGAISGNPAR